MATSMIVKGKKITVGSGALRTTELSYNTLADLLHASNNSGCYITSAYRDSANQARVMYNNIIKKGIPNQLALYGPNGDAVIYLYQKGKKANKTEAEIKADMTNLIQKQADAGGWDSHMRWEKSETVDIDYTTGIQSRTRLIAALKTAKSKGKIIHYIDEGDHFHIQIPRKQPLTDNDTVTDTETQSPSASPSAQEKESVWVKYTYPRGLGGKTVFDLVSDPNFIGYDIPANEMYDFEYNGKSNNQRLYEGLDIGSKKLFGDNETGEFNPDTFYPIAGGFTIYFPVDRMTLGKRIDQTSSSFEVVDSGGGTTQDSETILGSTNQPNSSQEINPYESNITIQKTVGTTLFPFVLRRLSTDPGYVKAYNNRGLQAKDIYPQFSAKIYSKVLALEEGNDGFLDITCDVIACNTSSRFEGTNWSITLQPKVAYLAGRSVTDNTSQWTESGVIATESGEYVNLGNINYEKLSTDWRSERGQITSEYRRSMMYYNMILQQNDMIWIKFERLGIEDQATLAVNRFGEWYDLIGLVDAVELGTTSPNTDSTITVRGRDLTKVLQDDNSYFNPYSIGHASAIYGDTPHANGRYLDGAFKSLTAITARSVQQAMEFIFHRVASIGYVPDNVFDQLQDKTEITFTEINNRNEKTEGKKVKGVWQCIKFFIDDSIRGLRLVDDSISNPDGSIWELFGKICQDPFVEMFTDTYGDKFYVIARRPPFEAETVREIVEQDTELTDEDGSTSGGARNTPRVNAYKEWLDEREKHNQNQNPQTFEEAKAEYLELLGDNPKSIEHFNSMTEDRQKSAVGYQDSQELDSVSVKSEKYPLVININEDDVLRDNLSFANEAYSWYQVTDRGNFAGAAITLGHIPSLYFDDIAQVFGNKRLEVVSNYSNYKFFQSNRAQKDQDLYADQASQHLAFLVETNIHLPFTRRGTITINGDRRIKKGYYIFYRPTEEIFYVIGVTHGIDISTTGINRITTLDVERGMIKAYVGPQHENVVGEDGTEKEIEISYFNIVDIPKLQDGVRDAVTNGAASKKFDYKSNITINKDVFNFFLQRRQFKTYSR